MKTKLLLGALVAFSFFSFAQQLADKLTAQDTKNFSAFPETYSDELKTELKLMRSILNVHLRDVFGGTYFGLVGG